jgi:hypothetical protein
MHELPLLVTTYDDAKQTAAGIGGFRSRSIGLKNGLFQSSTTRGAGPLPLFPETTRGPVTLIA